MPATMNIGICLPYMKAGLARENYLQRFRGPEERRAGEGVGHREGLE